MRCDYNASTKDAFVPTEHAQVNRRFPFNHGSVGTAACRVVLCWGVAGFALSIGSQALADTTVYGSIRIAENYNKKTFNTDRRDLKQWDLRDESSRLGFHGAEDLGNGLNVIYRFEFGVNTADGPIIGGPKRREAFTGLKAGWGQFTIGVQESPYYQAVGAKIDYFDGSFSAQAYDRVAGVDNFDKDRSQNIMIYRSPNFFGGVSLRAAVQTDADGGSDGIDTFQLAGLYDNGSLFLGAAYRQLDADSTIAGIARKAAEREGRCNGTPGEPAVCSAKINDGKQYGISAQYAFQSGLSLVGQYQRTDLDNDRSDWYSAEALIIYEFADRTAISANYYKAKNEDGDKNEFDGYILGVQHKMSKRTRFWLEYGHQSYDQAEGRPDLDDEKNLSIGMRHDF